MDEPTNADSSSTPLGEAKAFHAQFDEPMPGVMYASNSMMSDVDNPYPYVTYSQGEAEGLTAVEVTASRMPGATAYGTSYEGELTAWAAADSDRIDLNAAAFRSGLSDTSSSLLESITSFANWADQPIEWLQNVSQTVQRGNAIMAQGLDAVGLSGLAGAQRALGEVTSSSVPTRPWEVALSVMPLASGRGPAMRAAHAGARLTGAALERGAVMFGPQIEKAFELAMPGLRYNVVPEVGGIFQTGARQVINPDSLNAWDAADLAYDKIRGSNADITAISRNTGMLESSIERIKDHVFFNEHLREGGRQRFDADPAIANAWDRLTTGDWVKSDLDLLWHERFESRFEALYDADYNTAHNAAIRSGRIWIAG
ncbi:hypothetical protein QCE81_32485 [Caballeronia sp. LZ002]|nr:hypothetical protein [Caballeronia sp. LZ002]MDR5851995.1 hypothetical protein [Caballeronia sp. LZ003]